MFTASQRTWLAIAAASLCALGAVVIVLRLQSDAKDATIGSTAPQPEAPTSTESVGAQAATSTQPVEPRDASTTPHAPQSPHTPPHPQSQTVPMPTDRPTTTHATPVAPAGITPFKDAITTVFWAGEGATPENGFISNAPSAWDEAWAVSFGGLDDPEKRCGYKPCSFTPKENPFYVALPYYEYDEQGRFKENTKDVPWYTHETREAGLLLKNRWVEVRYNGTSCFGQWADVGPYEEDDFAYVFGAAPKPKNTQGERAGLDISPAVRDCLGMDGLATTQWRFVAEGAVPNGPWREIVTTSRPSFVP